MLLKVHKWTVISLAKNYQNSLKRALLRPYDKKKLNWPRLIWHTQYALNTALCMCMCGRYISTDTIKVSSTEAISLNLAHKLAENSVSYCTSTELSNTLPTTTVVGSVLDSQRMLCTPGPYCYQHS